MSQRLSKVLQAAGISSRRRCEEIIRKGRVRVNNEVILLPEQQVRCGLDAVAVDGRPIQAQEEKVYYLLHKPRGVVCSARRFSKEKIVQDLFSEEPKRLFSVGRLDKDTEGLLLVTNDGDFAQKVIHPSSGLRKEYIAKTDHEISHHHLVTLSQGMRIDGDWVRPVHVSKVRRGTVKIVLSQGKKHEARLLLEHAGLEVRSLKRTRIGDLHLGTLPVGAWRPLSGEERKRLLSTA